MSSWLQASRAAHTADMATIIPMHQTNVVSWREPFVGQSTASPNSRFGHPNAGPTGKRRNLASLEPGGEVAVPPGYDSATSPSTGHINTDFSLCRASLLTTSSPGTCSEPEIIAQNGAISVAKSARLSLMTRFGSSEMMTQPTRSWSRLLAVDSTRCPSSPGTGGGIAYTPSPPYHATGYSQGVSHGAAITGTDIGISLHGSSFPASRPIPCSNIA
ncbi:unnamed protein product [Protopolystoma xenopodis]|uniref:Uncharacterized protein n=1 Tax=Protopolystoma xenopodis TaxID=117903 RepID=A0A3S5A8U0_9PLAT|nr:unnamed protein product [Protopolystoma xenopodis]